MFGALAPLPLRLTAHPDGWSPQQHARAAADLTALIQTAPFAFVHVDTTTPGTITSYVAQHGSDRPTVTRNGVGDVTIDWDAAYETDFEASPTQITQVDAQSMSIAYLPVVQIVSSRSIRVRMFNLSAGARDGEFGLWVW